MKSLRGAAGLVFPVVIFFSFTGCASIGPSKYSAGADAPRGQLLSAPSLNPEDPATAVRWLGPVSEQDKIRFLLDRVARSHYRFIRNGGYHNGLIARQWLLYKMTHWVEGVNTAEGFVAQVANASQKTGKPYLVEFPDGKIYSLKSVLENELSTLERDLVRLKKRSVMPSPLPSALPPSPAQVSFSPTALATTAVATTSASTS